MSYPLPQRIATDTVRCASTSWVLMCPRVENGHVFGEVSFASNRMIPIAAPDRVRQVIPRTPRSPLNGRSRGLLGPGVPGEATPARSGARPEQGERSAGRGRPAHSSPTPCPW